MMNVHVILLAWRDPAEALLQYERIRAWDLEVSITLVHNEGGGLAPLPGLAYVPLADNRGYAGGINAGLQTVAPAPSSAILLLNNDAQIDEQDMRTLIAHLDAHPDIGIIGPVLTEGRTRSYGGRDPLRHIHTRLTQAPSASSVLLDVDYVPGTALLLRSELLKSVGVLNEAFFFSGEIADYCWRTRNAGWRCAVATDASARHDAADTGGLRSSLYRYYTLRNRFLMARERREGWRRTAWDGYWTLIGLLMWLRTVGGDRAGARSIILALRDGWNGEFGNRNGWFDV